MDSPRLADRLPIRRTRNLKGDLCQPTCPTRTVLDHVTSRWGTLTLIVLLEGTHRFSALARRVGGVSEKMLAQTLQSLEGDGFVCRKVYPTVPPKVEYSLTPLGKGVASQVNALGDWIEANIGKVIAAREKRVVRTKALAL